MVVAPLRVFIIYYHCIYNIYYYYKYIIYHIIYFKLVDPSLPVATFPMSAEVKAGIKPQHKGIACPAIAKPCQPVVPAVWGCHAATAVPTISSIQ